MRKVFPNHLMVMKIAEHLGIKDFISYEMQGVDLINWTPNPIAWRQCRHGLHLKFFFPAADRLNSDEFEYDDEGQAEIVYVDPSGKDVRRSVRVVDVFATHNGSVSEWEDFKKFVSVDAYALRGLEIDTDISTPQLLLNIGDTLFPGGSSPRIIEGDLRFAAPHQYEPKVLNALFEVIPPTSDASTVTKFGGEILARQLLHYLVCVDDYEKWGSLTVTVVVESPRNAAVMVRTGRNDVKYWTFKP